jgi:hypothetical protein
MSSDEIMKYMTPDPNPSILEPLDPSRFVKAEFPPDGYGESICKKLYPVWKVGTYKVQLIEELGMLDGVSEEDKRKIVVDMMRECINSTHLSSL